MSEGVQLILWIAGVHLIGFLCVAVLLLPALRENPDDASGGALDEGGDDGWGRGPRTPPPPPARPRGGIPLPDAAPASVRLREPGRLGERLPGRDRRPVREPLRRPIRQPAP